MSYYLKKTTIKGRTYLSIDESFYSHEKKGTAHKCYRSLGSVETLKASGMEDPIAFYQKEVDALNQERKRKGAKKIGSESPTRYLGYFPLKSIMEKLQIKKYVDYFKLTNKFKFDPYEILSSLIYARSVEPCGKLRETFPFKQIWGCCKSAMVGFATAPFRIQQKGVLRKASFCLPEIRIK